MERLACVEVPALPLQVLYERKREWLAVPGTPIAVVREDRPQSPILWVNQAAHALGVRTGMRYAAGLSVTRELRAAPVPPEALGACVERMTMRLRAFSPHVEPGEPGTFWLGAGGLAGVFDSPAAWARLITKDLAGIGYDALVVVGFTRFGTRAVARGAANGTRRTIVFATRGAETQAARKVELYYLGLPVEARDLLEKLGVSTVGALAKLPARGLSERFGAEVEALHQDATGRRGEAFNAHVFADAIEGALDLDFPEVAAAPQLAAVEALLPALLERLARRGLMLDTLRVRRRVDRDGWVEDALKLAAPSLELKRILELVRLRFEGAALKGGVVRLELTAGGVAVGGEQLSLLANRPLRDRAAAERALARLRAEFGDDAVLRARLREGHLPEAQVAWERLEGLSTPRPAKRAGARPLVRRVFDRPREIPALVERDGRTWLLRGTSPNGLEHASGPYTLCGGWWTGREVHREYHLARMRGGHILWVYFDVARRRWFLQGQVE